MAPRVVKNPKLQSGLQTGPLDNPKLLEGLGYYANIHMICSWSHRTQLEMPNTFTHED